MTTNPGPGPAALQPQDLDGWLRHIESTHPRAIEMGLDRVWTVRERLAIAPGFPLLIVGGTNGKGSTCAFMEAMLVCAGYRVGCYTSPHLIRYNERVRIDRREVADATLCEAFAAIEQARGDVPLTYFEFGTLAAVWQFERAGVDVAVLEVGLGGRLDAVNVFDAACATVTSIGIDHVEYLGPTRESIGFEKAGIFRQGRPAVIGDLDPPVTLLAHAEAIGAQVLRAGRDFRAVDEDSQWRYEGPGGMRAGLPWPALRGPVQLGNAAIAITALDTLRDRIPVSGGAMREGLATVDLPGRFQVLPGRPLVILDVAHNPHAAERLAAALGRMPSTGKTRAVFGMLGDKDIAGVARMLKPHIDRWHLAPLPGPRGVDTPRLAAALDEAQVLDDVRQHPSLRDALIAARDDAQADDRIVVFGSFLTVAAALEILRGNSG
jgi:dihydrofolate synthase / folylpolyglutamate synthase